MPVKLNYLILLLMLLVTLKVQAMGVAEVIGMRGEAVVNSQTGEPNRLALGSIIGEGATVLTKNGGRVKLRFVDGSTVVIGDSATFTVEKFAMGKDGKRSHAEMKLDVGLTNQAIAPSKPDSWQVTTPTVVTAVRGTEYLLEVKNDHTTEVNVLSGQVALNKTGRNQNLTLKNEPAQTKDPVLLQKDTGAVCNYTECKAPLPRQASYFQSLIDRLSGI